MSPRAHLYSRMVLLCHAKGAEVAPSGAQAESVHQRRGVRSRNQRHGPRSRESGGAGGCGGHPIRFYSCRRTAVRCSLYVVWYIEQASKNKLLNLEGLVSIKAAGTVIEVLSR